MVKMAALMRVLFALFYGLLCFGSFAQLATDRLPRLDPTGRVENMSISPAGVVWLYTSLGKAYYRVHPDSNWNESSVDTGKIDYFNNQTLRFFNFFNDSIGLLTGYIDGSGIKDHKIIDGYYLTFDAGKTWELKKLPVQGWVYSVQTLPDGQVWLSGAFGNVLYSNDFANTWTKLINPEARNIKVSQVWMASSYFGIAGAQDNQLFITRDNWKTWTKIETPFDQGMYAHTPGAWSTDRFLKVRILGSYFVVNQAGTIAYRHLDSVSWKKFPVGAIDFDMEYGSPQLFLLNRQSEIYKVDGKMEYDYVTSIPPAYKLGEILVRNQKCYTRNYRSVYETDGINSYSRDMFASYVTLSPPPRQVHAKDYHFGEDGTDLYGSTDGTDWRRIYSPAFSIEGIHLHSDSQVILWSGKENYLYQIGSDTATPLIYDRPLDDFLKHPLKIIKIHSGTVGCFHRHEELAVLTKTSDKWLCDSIIVSENHYLKEYKNYPANIQFDTGSVRKLLIEWNHHPYKKATITSFAITNEDIKKYQTKLDSLRNETYTDINIEESYYRDFPKTLDTISPNILLDYFNTYPGYWSTTQHWFKVVLINENKDTLVMDAVVGQMSHAWLLPFELSFKNKKMQYCSPEIPFLLNAILPEEFYLREHLSNAELILNLAEYLKN